MTCLHKRAVSWVGDATPPPQDTESFHLNSCNLFRVWLRFAYAQGVVHALGQILNVVLLCALIFKSKDYEITWQAQ